MSAMWRAISEAVQGNRGLAWGVWWNVALLAGSVAALPFDHRSILGLNPWVKPIKFEISVIVFLVTIACMISALDGMEFATSKAWLGWGFGVAMIVENSIIALQAARGVRSHMNYDTPLDAALFSVMGIFIVVNTLMAAWLLVLWFRTQGALPPAAVWGIRLGLAMLLAGSLEGVRMVAHGSHTVGAADGLSGLPFVNWSLRYGDLRVAHFFALHALQLFPLAGIALARTHLRTDMQISALFGFVLVYGGAVWWMFAEAMRGLPLFGQ